MSQADPQKKDSVNDKKITFKAVFLGLFVMLLWGSLFPVIKLGYSVFLLEASFYPTLFVFAGTRFIISGVFGLGYCAATKKISLGKEPKNYLNVLFIALFAFVLHYGFLYVGLSSVSSSNTSLLNQAASIVFICFSFLFFKEEKFTVGKAIAVVSGVASILIVNFDALKINFDIGSLLILCAGLASVVSNIVSKKINSSVQPVTYTCYAEFFAVGLLLGGQFGTVTPAGIGLFAYIIIATILSYTIWYYLVGKYDLSKLLIVKMAEPVFAVFIGAILPLNTPIRWQHLVAIALVATAILFGNVRFKREKHSLIKEGENI